MTETKFSPGDKVTARYGALLGDDGEPMTATVLRESPHPGDDGVLIRYRCPDGSSTDSWEKTGNLERATLALATDVPPGPNLDQRRYQRLVHEFGPLTP